MTEVTCRMLGLYYDASDYLEGYGYYDYDNSNTQVGSVRIVLDVSDKLMKWIDEYNDKHAHGLI